MHGERLVADAQFLAGDAGHARRRNLGLRHAHDVFVGHAHGKMPRHFFHELAAHAGGLVEIDQARADRLR